MKKKTLLILALFVIPAFAEGDMGGGGLSDGGTQPSPTPTPTTSADGDMGGGGFWSTSGDGTTLIGSWIRQISEFIDLV